MTTSTVTSHVNFRTQGTLISDGSVMIGTTTDPGGSALRVNQGGGASISDGWATWSRSDYKEEISDVSSGYLEKLSSAPPKIWSQKPFVSAEDIKIAVIEEFGQDKWDEHFPTPLSHRNSGLWDMEDGEIKTWVDSWAEAKRVNLRKLPEWQVKHIGSVADYEVTSKYLPEIVIKDGSDKPAGIDTMSYIGILHAAILELKAEIDTLKNG